jgi:hypothetical protein
LGTCTIDAPPADSFVLMATAAAARPARPCPRTARGAREMRDSWIVTRYEWVQEILQNTTDFLSGGFEVERERHPEDAPQHTRRRPLKQGAHRDRGRGSGPPPLPDWACSGLNRRRAYPEIGQQCLDSSLRNRARHLYFFWRKAKLLLLGCTIRFVFAAPEASTLPSQREESRALAMILGPFCSSHICKIYG